MCLVLVNSFCSRRLFLAHESNWMLSSEPQVWHKRCAVNNLTLVHVTGIRTVVSQWPNRAVSVEVYCIKAIASSRHTASPNSLITTLPSPGTFTVQSQLNPVTAVFSHWQTGNQRSQTPPAFISPHAAPFSNPISSCAHRVPLRAVMGLLFSLSSSSPSLFILVFSVIHRHPGPLHCVPSGPSVFVLDVH